MYRLLSFCIRLLTSWCHDRPNTKANGDDVSVYRRDTIANMEQISLTQGRMILIALLSGGDYSKVLSTVMSLETLYSYVL
jgi:hypothetical protein